MLVDVWSDLQNDADVPVFDVLRGTAALEAGLGGLERAVLRDVDVCGLVVQGQELGPGQDVYRIKAFHGTNEDPQGGEHIVPDGDVLPEHAQAEPLAQGHGSPGGGGEKVAQGAALLASAYYTHAGVAREGVPYVHQGLPVGPETELLGRRDLHDEGLQKHLLPRDVQLAYHILYGLVGVRPCEYDQAVSAPVGGNGDLLSHGRECAADHRPACLGRLSFTRPPGLCLGGVPVP